MSLPELPSYARKSQEGSISGCERCQASTSLFSWCSSYLPSLLWCVMCDGMCDMERKKV